MVITETSWNDKLRNEFNKTYFVELEDFINEERKHFKIFPNEKNVLKAFESCPLDHVKVVIIGQDPYPTIGHANGLAFSVNSDVYPLPKSLGNIFKEIATEFNAPISNNGDLTSWAEQGVLLLNNVLTVRESAPDSHKNKGWEIFTDEVLNILNQERRGLVYMLWGKNAQEKGRLIDETKNLVLKSVHPSPLSAYRGFFGCNHFLLTNEYLEKTGKKPITWMTENTKSGNLKFDF